MRMIRFGKTGLELSAVGLGGVQFSKISHQQVAVIIARARELGINWIETAYGYHDSEEKIGAAVAGDWSGLHIISKSSGGETEGFLNRVEESKARLRVERFDLYQFHGVDDQEYWRSVHARGGALAAARELKKQGLIGHLGVTTHNLDLALSMLEADWVESVQLPLSFLNTEVAASGFLDRAQEKRIGVLAMKPFAGGRLESSRLCLDYIYSLPSVLPVVGVEEVWQVEDLVERAEHPEPLTEADEREMQRIRDDLGRVFCRACRYCEPCPQEISIYQALYFPIYIKQMGLARIIGGGEPSYLVAARTCTECGQCEERCPFHLEIREGMKQSLALYEELSRS